MSELSVEGVAMELVQAARIMAAARDSASPPAFLSVAVMVMAAHGTELETLFECVRTAHRKATELPAIPHIFRGEDA